MKQFKQSMYQVITFGVLLGGFGAELYAGGGKHAGKEHKNCCKKVINADEIYADKIKTRKLEVCPVKPKLVHVECPKPTCDKLPVKHLFTMTISLTAPVTIPNGPSGTRFLVGMESGVFDGPQLKGTILTKPGGDWLTIRTDGTAAADARLLLQTEAGDHVYMTYQGIANLATGDIRTAPLFQADSNGPLAYLNNIQAVGIGKVLNGGTGVAYEIFALE